MIQRVHMVHTSKDNTDLKKQKTTLTEEVDGEFCVAQIRYTYIKKCYINHTTYIYVTQE